MKQWLQLPMMVATLLFLHASQSAQAQEGKVGMPAQISYQGYLSQKDGRPMPDGLYRIEINLYDAANASAPLWSETHTVSLSGGLFNIYIGDSRPLDLPFDRPYWLGIAVNDEGEMPVRTPLASSPYSFRANVADQLAGGAVSNINGISGPVRIEGYGGTVVTESDGVVRIAATSPKETFGPKVEIAPSSAQTSSASYSILHLNETGSGSPNLIEMEVGGTDKFVVENDGDVVTSGTLQAAGIDVATVAVSGATTLGDGTGADDVTINPGSGALSVSNVRIQDVAEPTSAQDAATKNYADSSTGTRAPKYEPFITATAGSPGLTNNRILTAGTGVAITDAGVDDGALTVAIGQSVETTATPTFQGATLTGLSGSSSSNDVVVSNGGTLETRTAASLASGFAGDFWTTAGNTGTTAGTDFLGTTDSAPFEIHVNESSTTGTDGRGRVARFEANQYSPNVILGYQGNSVDSGSEGVTISGGGTFNNANSAGGHYATIAGGVLNTIHSSVYSTIGGGQQITITNSAIGTIAGGTDNVMEYSTYSTIGGGFQHRISGASLTATISGGQYNRIDSSRYSTVSGGSNGLIAGGSEFSVISGGRLNELEEGSAYSVVGGGYDNSMNGSSYGVIGGGNANSLSGSSYGVIGGGRVNSVDRGANYVMIGGGYANYITKASHYSTISGGTANSIDSSLYSAIGGGASNRIDGISTGSVVTGGTMNWIQSGSESSVIVGGYVNTITNSDYATIAGGQKLRLNGADRSFGFLANDGTHEMTISTPDVAVFGNADLWLANNDNSASALRFYEPNGTTGVFPGSANYSSFEAGAQTANIRYRLPASAGTAGRLLSIDSISGTLVTLKWDSDVSLSSLTLNGATPVTNSRIVVNEGHWTSQGTAPTAVGDGTNLAAGVTLAASSTDVAGRMTAIDGGAIGTGVITVTFNNAYATDPIVLVVPANGAAAGTSYYVSNVTTTTFDLNVSTTIGNGTDAYIFNYHVIETD